MPRPCVVRIQATEILEHRRHNATLCVPYEVRTEAEETVVHRTYNTTQRSQIAAFRQMRLTLRFVKNKEIADQRGCGEVCQRPVSLL